MKNLSEKLVTVATVAAVVGGYTYFADSRDFIAPIFAAVLLFIPLIMLLEAHDGLEISNVEMAVHIVILAVSAASIAVLSYNKYEFLTLVALLMMVFYSVHVLSLCLGRASSNSGEN